MLIELKNIQKTYATKAGVTFRALSGVTTSFDNTGLVFLVGQSGSGKSTMLNVIGGLDTFDSGELTVAGRPMRALSAREVDSFRNTLIGFVFQEFNLIDTLSVSDNVRLALDMQSGRSDGLVSAALEQMGIADKAKNKTKDLSGGQRQRVAVARALVKNPRIILADEPTGSLDSVTGEEIFGIFKRLSADRLVIIVTHDLEKAVQYGDRIIEMKDGRIYRDVRRKEEGEAPEPECVRILSDTLVRVDAGQKLGDDDVSRINDVISESGRKTFLSFETDGRKVKALFPNLRDAVDNNAAEDNADTDAEAVADAAAQEAGRKNAGEKTEDALTKEKFVPYRPKKESAPAIEYKKSRLPAARSLRLGLTNLNHKKVRLIMTLVMSVVAFTLFGIAQSFTGYDATKAIARTVCEERYPVVALVNGTATASNRTRIRQSDIELLKRQNPGVTLYTQSRLDLRVDDVAGGVLFRGVVEVDDVTALGHAMLSGESAPPDLNSIIISQYAATKLFKTGKVKAAAVPEMVGHTLEIAGRDYVIAGIFVSDTEDKYSEMEFTKAETVREIDESTGNLQLFVRPGFIDKYVGEAAEAGDSFSLELDFGDDDKAIGEENVFLTVPSRGTMEKVEIDVTGVSDGRPAISSPDEIFLASSDNFLGRFNLTTDDFSGGNYLTTLDQLNASNRRRMRIMFRGVPVYASNTFRVAGLMQARHAEGTVDAAGQLLADRGLMVHQSVFSQLYDNVIFPDQILARLNGDKKVTQNFVASLYDNGFKINAAFVGDYDTVLSVLSVLRYVILGLALALCLLVVVLLYSFISASIRSTKKQIGILRALGAKQSDTFKIYAGEGFIVTILALIVASVLMAVIAPLLNLVFSGTFGYYFALISVGWWVYLTMAALTLLVTLVAVLIPLRKFTKITPIGAISDHEG